MPRGVFAAFALAGIASPSVLSQSCPHVTAYAADAAAKDAVVIDANSGAIVSGRTSFPIDGSVRLVFVHKNPVRYQYEFNTKARRIEGAVIADGLGMLGINWLPEKKKAEEQQATSPPLPSGEPADAETRGVECQELFELKELTMRANDARKAAAKEFDAALAPLEAKRREVTAGQGVISRTVPGGADAASALCARIDTTLAAARDIVAHPGFDELGKGVARFSKDLDALAKAVLEGAEARRCTDVAPAITAAQEERAAITRVLETIAAADEKLVTARTELTPFIQHADVVRASDTAFVERRSLGPADEATEYDVSISRTDRLDGAKSMIAVTEPVRLGRSRLTISAGIAVVFADNSSFERQASVSTSGGSTTVVDVVGIDESADAQIGAVGQLNVFLLQWRGASAGWSVGASLAEGSEDAQFGLYTGPTLGLAGDRFILTLAYHLHDEENLAGGFAVGDTVPAAFTGDIPVTTETKGGLLVSFTYKVR